MDFPKLPDDIKIINKQLVEHFGVDTITGKPIWRVSWSNDQYEKRLTDRTKEGLQLLHPVEMELPKYQWCRDKWILERLCLVPDVNQYELLGQVQSYECMYPFAHKTTLETIRPSFEACKFVVDLVYAAMGKSSMAKYVDTEGKNPQEEKEKRIKELEEQLFGDESSLLGRTITGEAVAYTGEPKINASQEEK